MDFFDLHCDTPYECYKNNEGFYVNRLAVSGRNGSGFNSWKQTFAVWIRDDLQNPWQLYRKIITDFKEKVQKKPKNLTPIFALEGGAVIENDTDRLYLLKNDGVRFITLTWNGENNIAGGIKSDKGLTDFGKGVISKMNELGFGCDVSHLNTKSFFDVTKLAKRPLATHSNCYAIHPHPRNLTDEQIRLIAQKGGIIGLCFYPDFLDGEVFESLYRNIFYICNMGLENNIAIGSDFDGGKMDKSLDNISKVTHLYRYLECRGLKKCLLDKIFYKNADNFIAKL